MSDRLNISPHACWVVCPLGNIRGHCRRVIYPRQVQVKNTEKKIQCSNGRFPAEWQLGQQREEQGDLFIFSLALLQSPYSGRRRNSIFIYAPIHRFSVRHPTLIQISKVPQLDSWQQNIYIAVRERRPPRPRRACGCSAARPCRRHYAAEPPQRRACCSPAL